MYESYFFFNYMRLMLYESLVRTRKMKIRKSSKLLYIWTNFFLIFFSPQNSLKKIWKIKNKILILLECTRAQTIISVISSHSLIVPFFSPFSLSLDHAESSPSNSLSLWLVTSSRDRPFPSKFKNNPNSLSQLAPSPL